MYAESVRLSNRSTKWGLIYTHREVFNKHSHRRFEGDAGVATCLHRIHRWIQLSSWLTQREAIVKAIWMPNSFGQSGSSRVHESSGDDVDFWWWSRCWWCRCGCACWCCCYCCWMLPVVVWFRMYLPNFQINKCRHRTSHFWICLFLCNGFLHLWRLT